MLKRIWFEIMLWFASPLLALMVLAAPVRAGVVEVGTTHTSWDGKTYVYGSNGYWNYNGSPHTRLAFDVTIPGTYYRNCYGQQCQYGSTVQTAYYYQPYVASYVPPVAPPYVPPSNAKYVAPPTITSPDFDIELLNAMKEQDKLKFRERQLAVYNARSDLSPYGLAGLNSLTGYSSTVAQGSTAYGYNRYDLASYRDAQQPTHLSGLDATILQQAYGRSVLNSGQFAAKAQTDLGAIVGQMSADQLRLLEYDQKARAAERVIRALDTPRTSTTTTTTNTTLGSKTLTPAPVPVPVLNPMPKAGDASDDPTNANAFIALANAKCAACHTGDNIKGGFDLSSYPAMNAQQKAAVWQRLLSSDPVKRMPQAPGGGPGVPLTQEEMVLFLKN